MDLEITLTLTCPHCGFASNVVEIEDEEDFDALDALAPAVQVVVVERLPIRFERPDFDPPKTLGQGDIIWPDLFEFEPGLGQDPVCKDALPSDTSCRPSCWIAIVLSVTTNGIAASRTSGSKDGNGVGHPSGGSPAQGTSR